MRPLLQQTVPWTLMGRVAANFGAKGSPRPSQAHQGSLIEHEKQQGLGECKGSHTAAGASGGNKTAHTQAAMAAIMVPGLFQRMDDHMTGIPECSSNNFAPMPSPRGSLESCGGMRPDARVRPLRKCASTPTLHSMLSPSGGSDTSTCGAEEQGMEVYVVLRPFKEFGGGMFNRMPRRVRAGVRDAGICHYLAVFKQRDGSLVQFDFGPRGGGDIHVAQGPFAFLSKSAGGKMQRLVPGEVRERRLSKLPAAHMLVGRTPLTLSDIRAWNSLQQQGCMDYELHRNDCRHYTNCLVQYTTGREQAASAVLSHQFNRARGKGAYGLATGVVRVSQWFTDLANWSKVQLVSNVSMYGMIAMSGQKALARLRPAALLPRAAARLQPVSKALVGPVKQALSGRVRHALVRKPVVVGTTAAVATFAASSSAQAPVLQESVTVGARVAGTFRTAAQATMAAAGTAVYRAGAVTTRTTSQAAVMAGSLAGAASRSAAGLMLGRQLQPEGGGSNGGGSGGFWGQHQHQSQLQEAPAAHHCLRVSLPSYRGADRAQRLSMAISSVARR